MPLSVRSSFIRDVMGPESTSEDTVAVYVRVIVVFFRDLPEDLVRKLVAFGMDVKLSFNIDSRRTS